jgi:hypothetical protein
MAMLATTMRILFPYYDAPLDRFRRQSWRPIMTIMIDLRSRGERARIFTSGSAARRYEAA